MANKSKSVVKYDPNEDTPTTFATRLIRDGFTIEEVQDYMKKEHLILPTLRELIYSFLGKNKCNIHTIDGLAGTIDINPATFHKYISVSGSERRNPERNTLLRIAMALQLTLEETQLLLKSGNRASLSGLRERDIVIMKAIEDSPESDSYMTINDELTDRNMTDLYGQLPEDKIGD